MKFYLSQINTSVGDLNANADKILRELKRAEAANCDLALFPEMAITGYDAQDLFYKKHFISAALEKLNEIIQATKGLKCAVLLGCPSINLNRAKNEIIYNSAFLIENGQIKKIVNKKTLPNYGVFDEKRYFASGDILSYVKFRDQTLALLICEDMWDDKNLYLLQEQIFDNIIVINSSPYEIDKPQRRLNNACRIVAKMRKPLIYVNQVGGQDALVFDGGSFVMSQQGAEIVHLNSFAEDYAVVEIKKNGEILAPNEKKPQNKCDDEKSLYSACVLGLRDYVHKTGHQKVLLGMSGGIDSALVAAIAVDALGCQNVSLYALPSRYNSEVSMQDALATAKNLGVELQVISIEKTFDAMLETLENKGISALAKENMQARIRGNILMALANSGGELLLSTGNKSEMAVGYATIYGDMCGAFNPLKDLYKTQIYKIATWRNENIPVISLYQKINLIVQSVLTKEPTAELRENQKDSDSLPPYEILDKILYKLIEQQKSVADIIKQGYNGTLVEKIAKLVKISEYKRRQAVIGPKVSAMSFDKDRRYPIANGFNQ